MCNFVRPGSVWRNCILSETSQVFVQDSLAFCISKGPISVLSETSCPKPLGSKQVFVRTSGNHIAHPQLLCTFISIEYCSSKQTQNDMIFLLPESRVSHVCSEADSHQGRGVSFLWSDSIPKHASLKNVLIDL